MPNLHLWLKCLKHGLVFAIATFKVINNVFYGSLRYWYVVVRWGKFCVDTASQGCPCCHIQGESLARSPKRLSINNYVIEIMTWKFIYTYRERCKTGPAHNRCWNWSPFTSKHTWMRFSKFWNTFPKVSTLKAWISWRIIVSLSCSILRGVFLYTLPFSRPQRKKSAVVRLASPCL